MIFKKFLIFIFVSGFLLSSFPQDVLARAGGKSSFSGGRSSTSYSNQGSRGSRTFQGGGSGSKNYDSMQRSQTQPQKQTQDANSFNQKNSQDRQFNNQNYARPNAAGSFFQRHPFLTAFGGALAASWIGHMIFGGYGMGPYSDGSSGFLLNLVLMLCFSVFVVFLVRRFTAKTCQNSAPYSFGSTVAENDFDPNIHVNKTNNFQAPILNITLPESEKNKFSQILVEVQTAWSNQDIEQLKKLATAEMAQYFSESLKQNVSQGIANKVEEIEIVMIEISEAWREDDLEYATAIIEWSSYDYMINLSSRKQDSDYVVGGLDKSLAIVSEAWTFVRHQSSGRWILSAIAQINKN